MGNINYLADIHICIRKTLNPKGKLISDVGYIQVGPPTGSLCPKCNRHIICRRPPTWNYDLIGSVASLVEERIAGRGDIIAQLIASYLPCDVCNGAGEDKVDFHKNTVTFTQIEKDDKGNLGDWTTRTRIRYIVAGRTSESDSLCIIKGYQGTMSYNGCDPEAPCETKFELYNKDERDRLLRVLRANEL